MKDAIYFPFDTKKVRKIKKIGYSLDSTVITCGRYREKGLH